MDATKRQSPNKVDEARGRSLLVVVLGGGGFEVEKRVWKLFISSVRQRGREEPKPGRRCSRVRICAKKKPEGGGMHAGPFKMVAAGQWSKVASGPFGCC